MSNVATKEATSTKTSERDVNFDNLEGLAEDGLKYLRDALVAFSDLKHEDGCSPHAPYVRAVEESMADARAALRGILDELKTAEAENARLNAEIAALKLVTVPASERRVKAAKKAGR